MTDVSKKKKKKAIILISEATKSCVLSTWRITTVGDEREADGSGYSLFSYHRIVLKNIFLTSSVQFLNAASFHST